MRSPENAVSYTHLKGGGNVDIRIAAYHPRRAGNDVLCNVKHRHCNVKGVGDKVHRHPRLEKPLKKHESVYVVHIVLFRYHADKLHA